MTSTAARALRFHRIRTPQEIADARTVLKHNGFTECDSCHRWSNEDQRIEASGTAQGDVRCAFCGFNWSLLSRQDAAS